LDWPGFLLVRVTGGSERKKVGAIGGRRDEVWGWGQRTGCR